MSFREESMGWDFWKQGRTPLRDGLQIDSFPLLVEWSPGCVCVCVFLRQGYLDALRKLQSFRQSLVCLSCLHCSKSCTTVAGRCLGVSGPDIELSYDDGLLDFEREGRACNDMSLLFSNNSNATECREKVVKRGKSVPEALSDASMPRSGLVFLGLVIPVGFASWICLSWTAGLGSEDCAIETR